MNTRLDTALQYIISAYWKYIEQTFAYFPTCICIVALEWTGLCTRVERTVYSSETICSLECNDTDSSRKKMAMIKEKHKDIRCMIHRKAVNNRKLLNKRHKKRNNRKVRRESGKRYSHNAWERSKIDKRSMRIRWETI